jgi:hypothetical protein
MNYRCPVCMFVRLPYPATAYHICPCCGTEFGNDDAEFSHGQLREMWAASGGFWFFGNPPQLWNPWMQLIEGGHPEAVPLFSVRVGMVADTRLGPQQCGIENRWTLSAAA